MSRKRIGCFINNPESTYQQRVLTGLMRQCNRYGWDLVLFTSLVEPCIPYVEYMEGEFNIFSLANFDLLDAVVVVSIPLVIEGNTEKLKQLDRVLKEKCRCPVISLDFPVGDYPVVRTDDYMAFREITRHVSVKHGCNNIWCLTGPEKHPIAQIRLRAVKDELEAEGKELPPSRIFYGDFWYPCGTQLAERIISGELELPEAVICTSDHMAIALVNRLNEGGIRVPDQVIVTGYDATQESLMNPIIITSYIPRVVTMAQQAINYLKEILEPKRETAPCDATGEDHFSIGFSCGCPYDITMITRRLTGSMLRRNRDYERTDIRNNTDIWNYLESYLFENLTGSKSPAECLEGIYRAAYLIYPYDHFHLCLRQDWQDPDVNLTDGYPEKMRYVMHSVPENHPAYGEWEHFYEDDDTRLFDTKMLHPSLFEEHEPSAFFFVPVHFVKDTLGYGVLQTSLSSGITPTEVFRNWIRTVSTSLQMMRTQGKLLASSFTDGVTGLYNRRGMDEKLKERLETAAPDARYLAYVVDMDDLKTINDTYGHEEGDRAISLISDVLKEVTAGDEIAIRAGGDEFYLLCVGDYTPEQARERSDEILRRLREKSEGLPYKVIASVGFCLRDRREVRKVEEVLHDADAAMYRMKYSHKTGRG
ncbi:MAG: hypothetical protein CW338_02720 [Clostridiales bacterium]|nr:hypothetical protein [Clostridiales bacterium]